MADTLATTITCSSAWNFQDALDRSTVIDADALSYSLTMADGTSASQADKVWHDRRTLATVTNDDLDLNALTNSIFGSTVTINLVKIRSIQIKNINTAAGDILHIDTSVANGCVALTGGASGKIPIGANGCLTLTSPIDSLACTSGVSDILRIYNTSANSIVYDITITGTSA